ncbi:ABC transporter ATP-binding protein [Desulfogranum japonicum]|uniref:ABC transporter ATP-binding protein n=1 Tax=Desulfogranum japonicum TaxID=231447 RepID=UPI000401CB6C|nr:ABC transporter ATP-binding protein [Desulfogranum japonicum]
MIDYYKHIMAFLGKDKKRVQLGIVLAFFESIFANIPVAMLLYAFAKLAGGTFIPSDITTVFVVMLVAVLVRVVLAWVIDNCMYLSIYNACERERLSIGDRFRYFPMGFFTKGNLGRVAAIISIDLTFVEEKSVRDLDIMINAVAMTTIGCTMLCIADIRIGLIAVVVSVSAIFLSKWIESACRTEAVLRQEQQGKLTEAILEYAMGISVIKAFNLAGDKAATLKNEIQETKEGSIRFEKRFIPPAFVYKAAFCTATALMVWTSLILYKQGKLGIEFALIFVIFALYVFLPAINLGGAIVTFLVGKAGLNRYEELQNHPLMGVNGQETKLANHEIQFHDVSFSYGDNAEDTMVLKDVSFTAKPGTMTALAGQSGSGKTTIANLIVRFWDPKRGSITLGGTDIMDMTSDCLLSNISMVFQRVYLFNDTIKNNIRFGKPDATDEEIMAAASQARCHEFISALPDGYDTMVTESGSSLSGGEKQRISIARAILKDAPIVLLDEATASIDPDNEKYIQEAISELVKNKTLIVIAHRLSTIRRADQILVIDKGRIVETGKHEDLLEQQGIYHQLWTKRMTARSWQMRSGNDEEVLGGA